jgi:PAS domain-containing protein
MGTEERELIEAVGISPIAMVVSNPRRPDNPLEIVNEAFCNLTGYSEREIVGRNCRFLAGELTDGRATDGSARPFATRARCSSTSPIIAATGRRSEMA